MKRLEARVIGAFDEDAGDDVVGEAAGEGGSWDEARWEGSCYEEPHVKILMREETE